MSHLHRSRGLHSKLRILAKECPRRMECSKGVSNSISTSSNSNSTNINNIRQECNSSSNSNIRLVSNNKGSNRCGCNNPTNEFSNQTVDNHNTCRTRGSTCSTNKVVEVAQARRKTTSLKSIRNGYPISNTTLVLSFIAILFDASSFVRSMYYLPLVVKGNLCPTRFYSDVGVSVLHWESDAMEVT